MIKGIIHQEGIIIINIYIYLTAEAPKHMKQNLTELKGEMDIKIIAEDFNIPHSIMDKTTRQEINKEIEDLMLSQLDLTDIYRILYPKTNA